MLLATPEDMLAAFGEPEMDSLVHREGQGGQMVPAEAVLQAALVRASGEAVSYLAARYPLFAAASLPQGMAVPPVLSGVVCDLARYHLTGGPTNETDPIVARYKTALDWLQSIAAGRACLPLPLPEGGGEGGNKGIVFSTGTRHWAESS